MDSLTEEVERFVRSYGHFYVTQQDNEILIKGVFDDLNPEPERSEYDKSLREIKRKIEVEDPFSVGVETVSSVNSRYGSKFIRVCLSE